MELNLDSTKIYSLGKIELQEDNFLRLFSDFVSDALVELGFDTHLVSGVGDFTVRTPGVNRVTYKQAQHPSKTGMSVKDWHRDAGIKTGNTTWYPPYIVLWTNISPTLIRHIDTHEVYNTDPNECVLINNRTLEHKMPKLNENILSQRWFARLILRVRT